MESHTFWVTDDFLCDFWWFCWLGLGNPRHIATKTPLEKLDQNLGLADPPPPPVGTKSQIFPFCLFEGSPEPHRQHLANANDPNVPTLFATNLDSFPPVQQYDNNNGCYAGSTTSCEQLLDCRCASVRLFCTDRCAPVGFLTNWRWNDDFLHNPDHFHR